MLLANLNSVLAMKMNIPPTLLWEICHRCTFHLFNAGRVDLQICGTIKGEKGIQRAEAMLYAIDRINRDRTLLPGVRLGCHILDTCLRDTYALEQSLEFIRPYMNSFGDQLCADRQPPLQDPTQQLKMIAGVIGASASVVSVMVANMLQLFKVHSLSLSLSLSLCLIGLIRCRLLLFLTQVSNSRR